MLLSPHHVGPGVWVLDDSPMMHRLLTHQISGLGCKTKCFIRAAELLSALVSCSTDPPSIVLVDLNLDDQNGIESLKPIRRAGYSKMLVLFSASLDETTTAVAQQEGADLCIHKPIEMTVLQNLIDIATRRAA